MCAIVIGAGERAYSEVDAPGSAARRSISLPFDISLLLRRVISIKQNRVRRQTYAAPHDLLSFDATPHPSCH